MPNKKQHHTRRGFRGGKNVTNKYNTPKLTKQEYCNTEQLVEEEVGITQYLSELEGYQGVIKQRFSDFQVNEIDLNGRIAKLTNTKMPEGFSTKLQKFSYKETEKSPCDKIPQETWEAVRNLMNTSEGESVILDAQLLSKDDRREIHESMKSYFGQKVIPTTMEKDGKTVMEFKRCTKELVDNRFTWPKDTPEYVHFIVYKELMDTMEACHRLSQAIRVPVQKITYAGLKDRRAKTSQWFSIKKLIPFKLFKKRVRNIRIGNIEFKDKPLALGDLKGNRFRIALRNVQADDELILKSMEHVKESGFINYYGMQRFGNNKEVPTHLIGVKLLLGEWKEAVDLILKLKTTDNLELDINKIKKKYAETGSAKEALQLADRNSDSCIELSLLRGLAKSNTNDYVNALENIPRPTRLMYIHAFQSLIFNKMASCRIKEFGVKPVVGDLVYVDKSVETEVESDINDMETDDTECSDAEEKSPKPAVKALAADDLENYSVYDILLPLPGYDIVYPDHMKQFYQEAIEEWGLKLEMPKQSVKTYNLGGTYRKVLGKCEDLEWKIMYFNNPTDDLIRSDLGELTGEEEPKSIENGTYKAVIVSFNLNPCSYATMVLREMMKQNTSSNHQSLLNNYADTEDKKTTLNQSFDKNKPTKVIEEITNGVLDSSKEQIEEIITLPGSLLANKEKYEDFKNNLFKDLLGDNTEEEGSSKRCLESEEIDRKKLKTE
ncbi:pseudouridylate synthase 7 homolog [Sitophilus oryzae]|uniref:Pseudouridylate synthase 7 homolog n=1 Tax=Sitophilus oryzae TaxID=7048 RepID=A0A6J2X9E5_SITOR|nr:pseudouridylate synthase 7 homolog [Sitophilus oryzae]XP_030747842.1 pseudouridylate synthase 7 homolog [Sitophilus oryzae]